jgi:hypothetical protein
MELNINLSEVRRFIPVDYSDALKHAALNFVRENAQIQTIAMRCFQEKFISVMVSINAKNHAA